MAAAQPWMKFYPQDWRADEKLRMCSLAARGLWIEMLAIMHRSERYGQLLISGRVPTDAQLAVQVGSSPDQVTALVAELEEADVFSRAGSGAIYSRRMTRDRKRSESAAKNGKKGGNPTLSNKRENLAPLNPQDKPQDKAQDKPQKPEARNQKEEKEEEPPLPPNDPDPPGAAGGKYVFAGRTIRLNAANLDEWAKAFHAIPDLNAELYAIDAWWQRQDEPRPKNWLYRTSQMLNRKHQESVKAAQNSGKPGASGDYLDYLADRDREKTEWEARKAAANA